jgi:lipoate-protein ligase B
MRYRDFGGGAEYERLDDTRDTEKMKALDPRPLQVEWLGRVAYETVLARQLAEVERRRAGQGRDVLWLLEHPAVITVGRSGGETGPGETVEGVPVVGVSRGGEATYHGPGQLVGYPILDLRALQPDLHWYLRQLEETLLVALAGLGVGAERRPPHTGVWVGERKIASIGVAVRGWITYHGFALNVNNDLREFGRITPCGLPPEVMGRLADFGVQAAVAEVAATVAESFRQVFGYQTVITGTPVEQWDTHS